jgi:hypothetical protein
MGDEIMRITVVHHFDVAGNEEDGYEVKGSRRWGPYDIESDWANSMECRFFLKSLGFGELEREGAENADLLDWLKAGGFIWKHTTLGDLKIECGLDSIEISDKPSGLPLVLIEWGGLYDRVKAPHPDNKS